ncbi:MAG: cell division protein FtsX [Candidatus Gracilibacteria bacterium]
MKRLLLFTWQNILRNKLLSLGAISVVMLVSFFLLLLDGMGFLLGKSIESVEKNVDYTIFLSQTVNVEDPLVQELSTELARIPATVSQVSKQQAVKEAEKFFSDDLITFVKDRDFLPASLVIKNVNLSDPQKIYNIISQDKYKSIIKSSDDRTFLQEQTGRLTQFAQTQNSVNALFIVLYILFTLVAVLIIFNTIRLLIHSRSEEIEIMELVGAEKNFIRFPFFGESMFLSACGVLLGVILFAFLLWQISIIFGSSDKALPEGLVVNNMLLTVKEFFFTRGLLEILKLLIIFMGVTFVSTQLALKNYLPKF